MGLNASSCLPCDWLRAPMLVHKKTFKVQIYNKRPSPSANTHPIHPPPPPTPSTHPNQTHALLPAPPPGSPCRSPTHYYYSLTLTHPLLLIHSYSLTHSCSLAHFYALTQSFTLTHSHSLTLAHSNPFTHSYTHSLIYSFLLSIIVPTALDCFHVLSPR